MMITDDYDIDYNDDNYDDVAVVNLEVAVTDYSIDENDDSVAADVDAIGDNAAAEHCNCC